MPDALSSNVIDVIELTRALVRCESVTPREAGALDLLECTLVPLGFRCERMDFTQAGTDDVANLYARLGKGGRHFCFAGHSDVVPVGDLSSWTIGPFAAELSGGICSAGGSRHEGAIAAFTEAAHGSYQAWPRLRRLISPITGDEGPAVNARSSCNVSTERGEKIDACGWRTDQFRFAT